MSFDRNSISSSCVVCAAINMSVACPAHDLWLPVDDGFVLHIWPDSGKGNE